MPKVAIIIDDIGYNRVVAEKLIKLGIPITFSILPYSPFGDNIAQKAKDAGIEIMLHLPLEPFEYPKVNPGKGAILSGMTDEEMIDKIEMNLLDVPYVKGVNNHMGSKTTSDEKSMDLIMSLILKKKLFFIDSRTTKHSVCVKVAKGLKVPFAKRDIFLDHFQDEENVGKQVDQLIIIAEKKGWAIGIGHPYGITLRTLEKKLISMKQKVQFVKASELTKILPPT
ncbi:MAG: divergent polysaccharide deacetylase family protein [Desulfobacterales bacterium]|nr:divergent polysaccharide deacetylase family protein [Desulfobacterales bacterium]